MLEIHRITTKDGKLIIGIGEKTIEKRIDDSLESIQEYFILNKKDEKKV